MKPLKIAMVTTFYPPFNFGGDGIYVQRMARALVARGHSVEVIHDTDSYRYLSGNDPVVEDSDDGIRVHRLRSKNALWSSFQVQQMGRPTIHRETISEILSDRFDVIHYHNVSLVGGPGVWGLGNAIKIHTAHEHWLVCPSHILWKYGREICKKKSCVSCVLQSGRPPQLWRGGKYLERQAENVDVFMTLSESAANNHRRFGFSRPMTVVPSFLPDEPDAKYQTQNHPNPYFLFVGRLEKIKGLQDVIPQFVNGLKADLLIAGTGGFEPELRCLAKDSKNIHFLGQQNAEQLRSLYRDAVAVVTPSRCYEVFPLVVLEAFREATPIVARNLGPYPEIVNESGGGLLFDDNQTLNFALKSISEDPKIARSMGDKAYLAYCENWTESVAMQKYFDVISNVTRQKKR